MNERSFRGSIRERERDNEEQREKTETKTKTTRRCFVYLNHEINQRRGGESRKQRDRE